MSEIILIASGESLEQYGEELRKQLPDPGALSIVSAAMEDAVHYAKTGLPSEAAVLMARGNTAKLLKASRLSIPIVKIPVSNEELLQTVEDAKALYDAPDSQIAYIGLESEVRSVEGFLKKLNVDIRLYSVENSKDIEYSVRRAKREHVHVVIGGMATQKVAQALGLHCVVLRSSLKSLREAYEQALEVQKILAQRERKLQESITLLNAVSEGVVSINERGKITVINAAAEQLFQCRSADVVGKKFGALLPEELCALVNRLLVQGDAVKGQSIVLGAVSYSADLYPVKIKGKNRGVMVVVREGVAGWSERPVVQQTQDTPLLGESPAFKTSLSLADLYAPTEYPVLLTGEVGTGKRSLARYIHSCSARSSGVFWEQYGCRLSPEDLLSANGGTLYLRHPEGLSPETQLWLTEWIESGRLTLPDHARQNLDIRLIVGTDRPLEGILDPELYYTLDTFRIALPPLRLRGDDICTLFQSAWEGFWRGQERSTPELPGETWELLKTRDWPGNLRQLKAACTRLGCLALRRKLTAALVEECLADRDGAAESRSEYTPVAAHGEAVSKGVMVHGKLVTYEELTALERYFQGNRTKLARELGVSRSTLWRYLKNMGEDA